VVPLVTHTADPEVTLPEPYGRVFFYQFLQYGDQEIIFPLLLFVPLGAGTDMCSLTCLTMANPMLSDYVVNQAAFLIRRQSFFSTASFKAS
jgi:hypothetical protein